jgi:hypothetical protein
MQVRAILRAALFVVAAATVSAGCGDDPNLPDNVAGRYNLANIGGQALPFLLPNTPAGTTARIKEGRITIEADGNFSQVLVFNITTTDPNDQEGDSVSQTAGTVEADGNTLRFKPRLETEFTGSLTGNGLTYTRNAGNTPLQFNFVKEP